jgi:hypothetical protein
MPVEIREILIRAVVDPQAGNAGGGGAAGGGGGAADPAVDIVKKVFEKLRDKEER